MQQRRRLETVDDLFANLNNANSEVSEVSSLEEVSSEASEEISHESEPEAQPMLEKADAEKIHIGIDVNLAKVATIAVLFMVVFALPIGIYNYWAGVRPTNQAINLQDPNARVAGASTAQPLQDNQAQTDTLNGNTLGANSNTLQARSTNIPNVLGVPINQILLLVGGVFLFVPVVILLRSRGN